MNVKLTRSRRTLEACLVLAALPTLLHAQSVTEMDDSISGEPTSLSEQLRAEAPLFGGSWTLSLGPTASAQEGLPIWEEDRPDRHAPFSMRGTRMARADEFLVGYQLEYRRFKGLRNDRGTVDSSEVFDDGYTLAPTEMISVTHNLQAYYGLSEDWTLYAVLPVIDKQMDYDIAGGGDDSFHSSGLGDLMIGATTILQEEDYRRLQAHVAIGIPTGSVEEKESGDLLPLPMQLGTGTYDLYPGGTCMWQGEDSSWGLNGEGRFHIGQNAQSYALSDSLVVSAWWTRVFSREFSGTARLDSNWWGDNFGQAKDSDIAASPVNDKHFQGGERLDLFGGVEWDLGDYDRDHRLGFEIGVPIEEQLDGPQLATHLIARLEWRISF